MSGVSGALPLRRVTKRKQLDRGCSKPIMFQRTDFLREGSVRICTCRKIGRDPWKQRNIFPPWDLESDIFWIDCGASSPFREKGKITKNLEKRPLQRANEIKIILILALLCDKVLASGWGKLGAKKQTRRQ